MVKLKSCPFCCLKKALRPAGDILSGYYITCVRARGGCGAATRSYPNLREATEAWNQNYPERGAAIWTSRLRALGYEEPTNEQRKDNLAKNVALLDWPK